MTREERLQAFRTACTNAAPPIPITAPYAFVETPDFCIPTPWGEAGPSHDKPHPDGISGEFLVHWTAETPLLVGGQTNPSFYHAPDGTHVLPGSSIRGSIRALLEAMTMARMNHVNRDAWFAERDFSGADSRWKQAMGSAGYNILRGAEAQPALSAGFLRMDAKDNYKLIPARWRFAKHAELGINSATFNQLSIHAKHVDRGTAENPAQPIRSDALGGKLGCLVYSGIDDRTDDKKKTKEAWFYDLRESDAIPVPKRDMDRFLYIHSQATRGEGDQARSALAFWRPFLATPGALVPVFYIDARKSIKPNLPTGLLMSFARSFKLPFRYSVGEILQRREASKDDQTGALDFVEALFGHVPQEGTDGPPQPGGPRTAAWRGRVQFGDARQVAGSTNATPTPGITGSPRPSYAPYYLRGDGEAAADWSTAGANLAGFKRYPLRGQTQAFPTSTQAQVNSTMHFLPAQVQFEGRVRFHNLLPAELGALLYALVWDGKNSPQRHAIGRGKAFGHGQMQAELGEIMWAEANSAAGDYPLKEEQAALSQAFKAYITDQHNAAASADAAMTFENIPAMAEVLAMQNPAHGAGMIARLAYPAQPNAPANPGPNIPAYQVIRKQKKTLPRYPLLADN